MNSATQKSPFIGMAWQLDKDIKNYIVHLALFTQPRPLASWLLLCNADKSVKNVRFKATDGSLCSYGESSITNTPEAIVCQEYYGDRMVPDYLGQLDHFEAGRYEITTIPLDRSFEKRGTMNTPLIYTGNYGVWARNHTIPFTYPLFIPTRKNTGISTFESEEVRVCTNNIFYQIIGKNDSDKIFKVLEIKNDIFNFLKSATIPSLFLFGLMRNYATTSKRLPIQSRTIALKIYQTIPVEIQQAVKDNVDLPLGLSNCTTM
jgi:hypothetical protein